MAIASEQMFTHREQRLSEEQGNVTPKAQKGNRQGRQGRQGECSSEKVKK
jgi:hypothetical protein